MAVEPVDIRKSFRGLSGAVRQRLQEDPLSGHLFCFVNVRRTMMKLLLCDGAGMWIYYRRLSRGTFELPKVAEGITRVQLDAVDLAMILEGIDLRSVTRRKRHRQPTTGTGDT